MRLIRPVLIAWTCIWDWRDTLLCSANLPSVCYRQPL